MYHMIHMTTSDGWDIFCQVTIIGVRNITVIIAESDGLMKRRAAGKVDESTHPFRCRPSPRYMVQMR